MGPRLKTAAGNHQPFTPRNKWDCSITSHDDSGQVYTEVTCAGTSMTAEWKWKTKSSVQEHGRLRSQGRGCSSLYEMAMRSCLFNSGDIEAETLEEVLEPVGVALWDRIVASHLDSVHLFLAFSKNYTSAISRKYHVITNPTLPLPSYLEGLTSLNCEWLTQLTLLHIITTRTALVQLSLAPNLAVLTIGPAVLASDIGVDDSLLRTWSRAASTARAFSRLRAIALRGQELVTARAFEYLNAFPALSILAIESTSGIRRHDQSVAHVYGWKYLVGQHYISEWMATTRDSGLVKRDAKWDAFSQALFALGRPFNDATPAAADVAAVDARPTVHLALGGYPGDAVLDVEREGAMRIWYRRDGRIVTSRTASTASAPRPSQLPDWGSSSSNDYVSPRIELQGDSAATSPPHLQSQKRALSPQKNPMAAHKIRKPVLRSSKMQELDDLSFLGFGT